MGGRIEQSSKKADVICGRYLTARSIFPKSGYPNPSDFLTSCKPKKQRRQSEKSNLNSVANFLASRV